MHIILNNGAPFSGKDTIAEKLVEHFGEDAVYIRFKDPLYERFAMRHRLSIETVIEICTGPQKDQPCDLIGGLIPRQELIDISENHIKKELGPTGVAYLVAEKILNTECHGRKVFIFPDSGFPQEKFYLETVLRRFGLTGITLLRILRDGCTFEAVNDSRSHLENPDLIIDNNVDEPEDIRGAHMLQQFIQWDSAQ